MYEALILKDKSFDTISTSAVEQVDTMSGRNVTPIFQKFLIYLAYFSTKKICPFMLRIRSKYILQLHPLQHIVIRVVKNKLYLWRVKVKLGFNKHKEGNCESQTFIMLIRNYF